MEWAYMATLSFLMGFACLAPFRKKGGCQIHSAVTYMMAGLLVLNVYAEYFSLFAGVGFWASLIAVFVAVIGGMLLRRDLADFFKISKTQACQKKTERSDEGLENSKSLWRKKNKAVWLLYAGLTLLFAYGSSRGYMHYDTGLYHAQAIRWIEEYGVVPGLANLHSRFGYNSASFALSAFFSETWLIGRPMHCVAGFFALLCACKCAAGLMAFWKRKKVRISDFLSIGGIFYLIAVFREMVSPASDYFAMLVLFWVIMTWVELWEQERDCPIGEKQTVPYALLSLYLVYAATVKLSTAVILLLVLYPAVLLLRQKKWLQIAGYIALGLLIAFPYLARNVLISGWLFYPFTFLDWFPVDWKISKGYADSDAKEIQAYAREIYNVYQLDQPLKQWLPNWFAAQAGFDKLLVLAGWAAIPVSAVLAVLGAVCAVRADRVTVASRAGGAASADNGTHTSKADRVTVALHAGSAVSEREIGAPLPARRVAHLTPLCFSLLQLMAALFYAVQIYCDFASYSMIAVGVGRLFGFELVQNFKQPYFARNLTDFWRRWHISLSSWLRDYIYIPLGGGRKGLAVRQRNILLVFLISGLWHGGAPQFLAWGLLHGAGQVVQDFYKKAKQAVFGEAKIGLEKLRHMLSVLLTFFTVMCFWIFFRSESVSMAVICLKNMFTRWNGFLYWRQFLFTMGLEKTQFFIAVAGIAVLFGIDLISEKKKQEPAVWIYRMPLPVRWAICLFLIGAVFVVGQYGKGFDPSGFIYVEF